MEFANTKDLNKRIATTMAICTLALIAILFLRVFGLLNLDKQVILTISTLGIFSTLSPLILLRLKVNDTFLKYYMFIMLELTIGALGCSNKIGIYLSFVVVPIASCIYFDKKLTHVVSIFSYIIMGIAVYINAFGKMEIKYYEWTHSKTFLAYFAGFTIEYAVVMLFVFQFLHRAIYVLQEEKESSLRAKAQEYRYELLCSETSDIIFEYFINEKKYVANRSLYAGDVIKNISIDEEGYKNFLEAHPEVALLREHIENNYSDKEVEKFEIDLSTVQNGEKKPLWFSCESFVVYDNEKPVSVIGKLHDITVVKQTQERLRKQRVAQMYSSDKNDKKNSMYQLLQDECMKLTEADFDILAEGHQFLTKMFDKLKYSEDLSKTLGEVLEDVGNYFAIDRICVLESDVDSGTNAINYQWAAKEGDFPSSDVPDMDKEEMIAIKEMYNAYGCCEINPKYNIHTVEQAPAGPIFEFALKNLLGNQIWIPTLSGGKYNGAIFFDKHDATPYTIVEKLLLSDAVNTISAYVNKVNAEASNQAKSVFLSTMSHEIRTPMNAIVGMTEVALRDNDMNASVRKCLKTVQSAAFGLLSLINDILDFSKIEAGKIDIIPEKFHIFSMVNDVYEIVKARNNDKLEIKLEIDENLPSVLYGDVVRIKQVMINFCTNAIKYTDSGYMKIKIKALKDSESGCLFSFSVEDSGIGIKKEDLGKLFTSYGQVDTKKNHHKEGTGLGLAISKQLVDLMDGSVSVESEYGKGSTFSFFVPLKVIDFTPAGKFEDFEYSELTLDSDSSAFKAPGVKVLLVDDTKVNLMVAKALLSPMGLEIDEADSGIEAIEKAKTNTYDIILMDYFMPGMNGVEASHAIRDLEGNVNRDVPIIALTADAASGVKEELISEGLNDFITKPIVMKSVYHVLRKWIPRDKIVND